MDYNNQNPYEQNSGTNPYLQSGTQPQDPYGQGGTQPQDPYGQSGAQSQSSYSQYGTQSQDPYGQVGTQQSQGAYSQAQGTQDSGQNSYYQNPYYQSSYQQSGYQQPQYQGYQTYQSGSEMEEPMSLKEWLITDLLLLIPCANFILIFVWAFSSSEKKSKSNFFKAQLIFMGCILAFYLLLFIIAIGAGFATAFTSFY